MSETMVPVSVKIMDKEFQVACPEKQQESLRSAAKLLDGKMRDIRDSRRVIGTDRIAIMAALNLAHELLQARTDSITDGESFSLRIKNMQEKIQGALNHHRQLEL